MGDTPTPGSILLHLVCACPRGCVTQSRGICDGIRCWHDNPVRTLAYNTTCLCTAFPSGERARERGMGRC